MCDLEQFGEDIDDRLVVLGQNVEQKIKKEVDVLLYLFPGAAYSYWA